MVGSRFPSGMGASAVGRRALRGPMAGGARGNAAGAGAARGPGDHRPVHDLVGAFGLRGNGSGRNRRSHPLTRGVAPASDRSAATGNRRLLRGAARPLSYNVTDTGGAL